jgi:hypothetical protein
VIRRFRKRWLSPDLIRRTSCRARGRLAHLGRNAACLRMSTCQSNLRRTRAGAVCASFRTGPTGGSCLIKRERTRREGGWCWSAPKHCILFLVIRPSSCRWIRHG